jgi:ABC-type uncharacterized transport system permease subunit
MSNRYFITSLTAGVGMITVGVAAIVIGATENKAELIWSIAIFSVLSSFAIWGIVNLIKGRCDNG